MSATVDNPYTSEASRHLDHRIDRREYKPVALWPVVPHGITFRNNATAVAVDAAENVLVYNRGNMPLVAFSKEGNYLYSRSDVSAVRPHSIIVASDGSLFLVDEGAHRIEKRDADGDLLAVIDGVCGSQEEFSGKPFHRPTDIAECPVSGRLFVSDGYRNARVHEFSAEGQLINSWGEPGSANGQFSLPHGLCVVDDRVFVCDRENHRIQIFDLDGHFLDSWHAHRPLSIRATTWAGQTRLIVGENRPHPVSAGVRNAGACIRVLDLSGQECGRLGTPLPGHGMESFMAPHSVACGQDGEIYVAEVSSSYLRSMKETPPLGEWVTLRKWEPV